MGQEFLLDYSIIPLFHHSSFATPYLKPETRHLKPPSNMVSSFRFQCHSSLATRHSSLLHVDHESTGAELQLCALRHRTQMYDHAILIA